MKIDSKTIQVYDWFAIEEAICKEMQIPQGYFSSYHRVVGNSDGIDYKNLWHVALDSIVPSTISNDTIVKLWTVDEEYRKECHPKWTHAFFDAVVVVFKQIDPLDKGVYVKFSW